MAFSNRIVGPYTRIASGTINPNTIVAQVYGTDDEAAQCAAGARPIGISGPYSTASGTPFEVYGPGNVTELTLGGTVNAGDKLKSDADGNGIVIGTTSATNQNSIGIAMRDGVQGDIIPVLVDIDTLDNNLTIS